MEGRTYRYYRGEAVYPFGHGLSYTTFSYGPLTVTPAPGGAADGLRIETELRNTGDRAGSEVAQLYLDFPDLPGTPNIALRGFRRVALAPGARTTVRFDLSPRDLSAVDPDGLRKVMAGDYRVFVGSGQPGTGAPVSEAAFSVARAVDLPR
jgi:beta-glucosidase